MDTTKHKNYRKNEWRKVCGFFGNILYEWRPYNKKSIEIKEPAYEISESWTDRTEYDEDGNPNE